jgi:hypothetical protein
MVKELAPMAEKDELTDRFRESMVVRIPMSAMIPNAIINMVKIVLSRFDRIDRKEIL